MRLVLGWLDDRLGFSTSIKPLIEHPVPPTGWDYTLGSATLIAFIVQVVTGVALAFTYVPTPDHAYESLEFITHQAVLGNIVRGIHFWGASAMVLLVAMHAAQVFLVGAFKYPREVNWLSGTLLLVFTFGMAFTGQLLRWNQDAYWAVVVGAAQAARAPLIGDWLTGILFAGQSVGGATLTRFYATHVFMLPAVVFGLLGLHLYLVIRHGVSEPPQPGVPVDKKTYRQRYDELMHRIGVPFWPDAGWKDVVFALAVGSVVLLLSIVFGPPELGNKADPTIVQAYPRPDWYFLWYFSLLALVPSNVEDVFIIAFPLVLGLLFVLLPFLAPTGERSPRRRPWAVGVVALFAVSIASLVAVGYQAPWSPVLEDVTLPASLTASVTGTRAQGAQLFQQRGCINCHRLAGAGGQRGPDLTEVGARLSDEQLTWRILNGGRNMPAYGTALTPQELSALVDFLAGQR
ncbi:MAG: cytochrome b N-terminal domain-containing protein [Chloroflexota bacterium]|nr:cytochrome b N-terminal domain-containing protein [Chloroflexota bacterium]